MKISLMQAVDYWIGIPLCFLVSGLLRVARLLSPYRFIPPARVLCIELSEMGSTILAGPAIAGVVDRLGPDNVYFMIFRRNRKGIELLNLIPERNIIEVDDSSLVAFAVSIAHGVVRCWKARIDTAVDLEIFSRCAALLTVLVGARNRVGLSTFRDEGLYRADLFTHTVLYSPHHHMSRVYAALIGAAFEEPGKEPLLKRTVEVDWSRIRQYQPPAEIEQRTNELLASLQPGVRLVIMNPDPGVLPLRGWPVENFAELARRITQEFSDICVAVTGVERAGELARKILQGVAAERALNLTGKTESLEELLGVLGRGDILVTIDSGPAHLASLTKIQTIVLFGPETPELYLPMGSSVTAVFRGLACSPCFSAANHRTSTCNDNQCMKQITVAEVLGLVASRLNQVR